MIKKIFLLLFAVTILGCSYGQNYLENPESFIRDPHFGEYKKNRDELERSYLHKEITYAEYIRQRDKMDEVYAKEVQERDNIISSE